MMLQRDVVQKWISAFDGRTGRIINEVGAVVRIGIVVSILPDLRVRLDDLHDELVLYHTEGHLVIAIEQQLDLNDMVVMLPAPGHQRYLIISRIRTEFVPSIVSPLTPTTGTVDINFLSTQFRELGPLTGNITFTTSNLAAGKSTTIKIQNGATLRTFTFPGTWKWLDINAPSDIAANKIAILSLISFGTTDSDIVATYGVEL